MDSTETLLRAVGIKAVEGYGISVHAGTLAQYLRLIALTIRKKQKIIMFDSMNLHGLYFYLKDRAVRLAYEKEVLIIDSVPIILLMKLRGQDVNIDHRVTGCDFVWPFFRQIWANNHRVFCLGNHQPTVDRALPIIKEALPGIAIDGRHGFFDQTPNSAESLAIIDEINQFQPDVLTVGFGSPFEQKWIAAHRHLINAPVVVVWGACMEYVAGIVTTPPRWMGRWGLEWFYRLAGNPRRFAFRYLVEPWALVGLLIWHNLPHSRSTKRS
jgi:N-acetylglucosaminyldiphosphoundecaprenol N-acetyl-beta-D-mannosaminyltransferase